MAKRKRNLSSAERAEKKRRGREYMTILIKVMETGKQLLLTCPLMGDRFSQIDESGFE